MDIGLYTFNLNPTSNREFLTEFARCADERGFSSIWFPEHVVTFDSHETRCPYTEDGTVGVPDGVGFLEPLTSMAFVASITENIRLGTGIAILPQRQPLYTAKEVANVDWLSGGRVDLGVGLGWCREEYDACGVPFERRGARCDEYIELLHRLWYDEHSSFKGEFYDLPTCRFYPKPVQPRLPIHIGGEGDAALRRVARHGEGWHGMLLDPDQAGDCVRRLDAALRVQGRSLSDVRVTVSPHHAYTPPPDPDSVRRYADAGVQQLVIWCLATSTDRIAPALDEIARTYHVQSL